MAKSNPPNTTTQATAAPPGDGGATETEDPDETSASDQRINAIVTNRIRREMKSVHTALSELKSVIQSLASTRQEPDEGEGEEDPATAPSSAASGQTTAQAAAGTPQAPARTVPDTATSRRMARLERQLAEEQAARKQAEEARVAELERGRRNEMRSAFSAVLTEAGVTDRNLLRSALSILEEDGVMARDDGGAVKFKGLDQYGIEALMEPKIGVQKWLSTDGKSFLPPVDAQGSGQRPGGKRGLTSKEAQKMSPQQLARVNLTRACQGLPPVGADD